MCLCAGALAPAGAAASTELFIDGAGNGHGVGMSQWGAYGLARHGFDYRAILTHYYTGTQLATEPNRSVRVLLQTGVQRVSFSGATSAAGKRLRAGSVYGARETAAGRIALLSGSRALATVAAPLEVRGAGPLTLRGGALNGLRDARYRGIFRIAPASIGGLHVIDVVPIEQYLRGVIGVESDPSWPAAALEAQAVASRTYAITAGASSSGFDVYADTRSQQYDGVHAEGAGTDSAVHLTAGEIVTYAGRPAITYYFDSSGGRTESIQYGFPGTAPAPWLVSVNDPYDSLSPEHFWGPQQLSLADAQARLGDLVHGTLRAIDVVRRGDSPRIVTATVVGSAGSVSVGGPDLASRLGLQSTWDCFAVASSPPTGWDSTCRGGGGAGGGGGGTGGAPAP